MGITAALVASSHPMDANYFNGKRKSSTGGYDESRIVINVRHDVSVANHEYTNILNIARESWNLITVVINVNAPISFNGLQDTYFVGTSWEPGEFGLTRGYVEIGGELYFSSNASNNWHHCTISIYNNQLDAANATYEEQLANAAHEVGHSLKMAHTNETDKVAYPDQGDHEREIPAGRASVMRRPINTKTNYGVQEYDQDELIAKWGLGD